MLSLTTLVVAAVVLTRAVVPLVGLLVRTAVSARGGHPPGMDAIVVLGTTLEQDGAVPVLLRRRLDRAARIYRAEVARGRSPLVVASGGLASPGCTSQAAVMADHLQARGVPVARLVREDRSRTTQENLLHTAALLAGRGPRFRELVVTSDYHVWRTAALAREIGLDVDLVGAPTPHRQLARALAREYVLGLGQQNWSRAGTSAALAVGCWLVLHPGVLRRRAPVLPGRAVAAALA